VGAFYDRPMRSRLTCALLLTALGGCGHTTTVGAGRTIAVGLSEYRVMPQSVRAPSGELTILVHNYGRLTHNLVVSSSGKSIGSSPPIAPGASATVALDLAPGKYVMASTILGDQALGEYGTLTIR